RTARRRSGDTSHRYWVEKPPCGTLQKARSRASDRVSVVNASHPAVGPGAVILRPPRGGTATDVAPRVCRFQAVGEIPRGLHAGTAVEILRGVLCGGRADLARAALQRTDAWRHARIPAADGGESRMGR